MLQVSTWLSWLECFFRARVVRNGTGSSSIVPTSFHQYHLPVLCDFAHLFRLVVGDVQNKEKAIHLPRVWKLAFKSHLLILKYE